MTSPDDRWTRRAALGRALTDLVTDPHGPLAGATDSHIVPALHDDLLHDVVNRVNMMGGDAWVVHEPEGIEFRFEALHMSTVETHDEGAECALPFTTETTIAHLVGILRQGCSITITGPADSLTIDRPQSDALATPVI